MKKSIIVILTIFNSLFLLASDNNKLIEEATKLYSKGNYEEAIKNYEIIINQGYESPELYYNLGNAYFKTEQFPRAILNYERAKKLSPNDKDIEHNIKIANLRIVDKIESLPELFFVRWWKQLINLYSADSWGVMSIVFLVVFLTLFTLFMLFSNIIIKKISFYFGLIFLSLTVFSYIFAQKQLNYERADNYAIIIAPTVTAKSSPDNSGTDLFVIHEGLKVKITDKTGEWCEVKLPDGKEGGWIMLNTVEII